MGKRIASYAERMKWFHQARFGMFIHFGLYSLLERGEWVMFQERIPADRYARLADRFRAHKFDPSAWAGLAAEAGMKYMLLTTRHHDGYCLYDSQVSDFTSVKTAARRDFVAEYVQACRREGLKVGLYYSLLDWRFPGYFEPDKHPESAAAMVQQAHDQVRELMSNYGKIDVLWYDGAWLGGGITAMTEAEIVTFWQSKKLNAMARRLQPHILINNRAGVKEDLDTPEQEVTASRRGRGWEACMTMGDFCGWGYIRNNPNMKSVVQLLQHLVTAAAGEGNFVLNVGPRGDGSIDRREVSRLREIGKWLRTNGEAIYNSQRFVLSGMTGPGSVDWNMLGLWTAKGNAAYLHVFRWPGEEAVLPLIKGRAVSATVLQTGQTAKIRQEHNGRLVIYALPKKPPHPCVTVIKIKFAEKPHRIGEADKAAWLIGKAR